MAIPPNTRFLIAEDDKSTREELVSNLQSLGFKGAFLEAENGKEAYSIFENAMKSTTDKIGFIISDFVMPITSGYDFLVLVRKTPDFQNIPFLMLTSKQDKAIVLKCVQAKVSNYLIKPWNVQTLGEKLHSCWNKHHTS